MTGFANAHQESLKSLRQTTRENPLAGAGIRDKSMLVPDLDRAIGHSNTAEGEIVPWNVIRAAGIYQPRSSINSCLPRKQRCPKNGMVSPHAVDRICDAACSSASSQTSTSHLRQENIILLFTMCEMMRFRFQAFLSRTSREECSFYPGQSEKSSRILLRQQAGRGPVGWHDRPCGRQFRLCWQAACELRRGGDEISEFTSRPQTRLWNRMNRSAALEPLPERR